jgi:hypothetical protein
MDGLMRDQHANYRWPCAGSLGALILALCGCWEPPRETPVVGTPAVMPDSTGFILPSPSVVMAADPAPPFIYWAPQGATIRNHPDVPGIWLAEADPGAQKTYFGDACGAAMYQHLVGTRWSGLTEMPPATEIRTFCTSCARTDDLRPSRINIAIDEATSIVSEIACF